MNLEGTSLQVRDLSCFCKFCMDGGDGPCNNAAYVLGFMLIGLEPCEASTKSRRSNEGRFMGSNCLPRRADCNWYLLQAKGEKLDFFHTRRPQSSRFYIFSFSTGVEVSNAYCNASPKRWFARNSGAISQYSTDFMHVFVVHSNMHLPSHCSNLYTKMRAPMLLILAN